MKDDIGSDKGRTDTDRLNWLSERCYLPEDHPDKGLFVVVDEESAPMGSFLAEREFNRAALRLAIDRMISLESNFNASLEDRASSTSVERLRDLVDLLTSALADQNRYLEYSGLEVSELAIRAVEEARGCGLLPPTECKDSDDV